MPAQDKEINAWRDIRLICMSAQDREINVWRGIRLICISAQDREINAWRGIRLICNCLLSVCLSGCLFFCLPDHNSGTPRPICLKFWLGKSGDPRKCF